MNLITAMVVCAFGVCTLKDAPKEIKNMTRHKAGSYSIEFEKSCVTRVCLASTDNKPDFARVTKIQGKKVHVNICDAREVKPMGEGYSCNKMVDSSFVLHCFCAVRGS